MHALFQLSMMCSGHESCCLSLPRLKKAWFLKMQLTFEHNASLVGANNNYYDSVLAELAVKCVKEHYLWYILFVFHPKEARIHDLWAQFGAKCKWFEFCKAFASRDAEELYWYWQAHKDWSTLMWSGKKEQQMWGVISEWVSYFMLVCKFLGQKSQNFHQENCIQTEWKKGVC